jgi:hypothetical protein
MGDAIDNLIEEMIVDAYGPYEQLCSFRQIFEDTAAFPFAGRIIGVDVVVDEVDYEGDDLRGLVAICRRDGQRYTVSLLDVSLADPVDPETAQLLAAYRRAKSHTGSAGRRSSPSRAAPGGLPVLPIVPPGSDRRDPSEGDRDERACGTAAGSVLRRDLRGTRPCDRAGATHLAPSWDRPRCG